MGVFRSIFHIYFTRTLRNIPCDIFSITQRSADRGITDIKSFDWLFCGHDLVAEANEIATNKIGFVMTYNFFKN